MFFFFSSRRRHTRFSRDWSSDVCSSDLYVQNGTQYDGTFLGRADPKVYLNYLQLPVTFQYQPELGTGRLLLGVRSEEHTSELQSRENLVCRLLLEKKNYTPESSADHRRT